MRTVAVPVVEPPLDRAALMMAVARAGSAAATGEDDRERQRELDGKRFELRLRFGCPGPGAAAGEGARRWSFDEKRRVLRISVAADIGKATPAIGDVGAPYEAVEGFRITLPWMLSAACPVSASRDAAPAAVDDGKLDEGSGGDDKDGRPSEAVSVKVMVPFVGIAQFFTQSDARTHRRGQRPYEVTKTLTTEETPSASGYDLILSGRLKRLGEGRVITCALKASNSPPDCVIAAEFDNVSIVRGDNAEQLGRWSAS